MSLETLKQSVKKSSSDYKDTLKFKEERQGKVKKALFTYIQDNNVEIISDDQVFFEGRHLSMDHFADIVKRLLESKGKAFPVLSVSEYVNILRELKNEDCKAQELLHTDRNSRYLSEAEILAFVGNTKLNNAKSIAQAEEFLQHVLFKIPDSRGAIKVIVKRYFEATDFEGNVHKIEKEMVLPGVKYLQDYEIL